MTFDPLKFYEDSKRRESLWGAVTPFILVGLLLLVMGVAGYLGYKSVKPKHALGTPAIISYTKLAADLPNHDCVYRQGEGWGCGDPNLQRSEFSHVTRPRKHKRKTATYFHIRQGDMYRAGINWQMRFDYEWTFINTLPTMIHCSKLTGVFHGECESRPLTQAEIEMYKPMAEEPPVPTPNEEIFTIHRGPSWVIPESATPIAKSSCVMPADIDVCPVQMLGPKAVDDKKGKP
jgi:hypothetical protein